MSPNYPLLNSESCRVELRPETGFDQPPVRLPSECFKAVQLPAKPYDFALERSVLKKKEDRESEWSLGASSSRDELEKNVMMRMRSVTNASEDVCVSLLEAHGYDLKTSIEAYLSSSS